MKVSGALKLGGLVLIVLLARIIHECSHWVPIRADGRVDVQWGVWRGA